LLIAARNNFLTKLLVWRDILEKVKAAGFNAVSVYGEQTLFTLNQPPAN
jgi:hypothetical protein